MGETMSKINQIDANNLRIGCWEKYYPDGQLAYKGVYENGRIIGYWEFISPDRKIIKKCFYARKPE